MKIRKAIALILFICISAFFIFTSKEIVISGSMEPEIKTGSIAFISKNIDYENIKEGDIISYDLGKTKVLHRVIDKNKEGLITKGDNNNVVDFGIVTESQINGKYLFSIPLLGYMILFISKHILILVCFIVIFIVIKKGVRKNE